MAFFLRAKRAGAIPAMVLLPIFLTLFSILGTVYLAVGGGNPINKVTHTLWSNQNFRVDAGTYFVSKGLESATGEERKILLTKGPKISTTVTAFLANPVFHQEIDQLSGTIYSYYSSGSKQNQTVDVSPVLHLALMGLESVDPQFSKLKKELDKIKPIKLQPQKKGPDPSSIRTYFELAVFLLLLLTLLTLLIYARYAKSLKAFVRNVGITFGVIGLLMIAINIAGMAIVKHQASTATESLVRTAVPIAAHPFLAPFLTVGVVELLLSLSLFIRYFLKRMNVDSQS